MRVLKNIAAVLGTQIWSAILGLIILPVLVHSFGTAAYGILALSLSVIGIACICDLGIGRALSKYIAEESDSRVENPSDGYAPTALTLVLVLSALTTCVLFFSAPYLVTNVFRIPHALARSAYLTFVFTSLAMPGLLLRILLDGILVGHHEMTALSAVNAAGNTLKMISGLVIALAGCQIQVLAAAYVVVGYLHAIGLAWLCMRGVKPLLRPRIGWNRGMARKLLKLGSFSTLATSMGFLFLYIDRWLLGIFLPIEVVGIYSITFDLASKQWYLANSVSQGYFPVFSQYSKSRTDLSRHYVTATKLTTLLVTGAGFALAVFQKPLLAYWIGPRFASSAWLIGTVLSFALIASCYSNVPTTALLTACERPDVTVWIYGAATLLHVAVSLALLSKLGGVAVAYGCAAGYVVVVVLASIWVAKHSLAITFAELIRKSFLGGWVAAFVTILPLGLLLVARVPNLVSVLAAMSLVYGIYLCAGWFFIYSEAEREVIRSRMYRAFAGERSRSIQARIMRRIDEAVG